MNHTIDVKFLESQANIARKISLQMIYKAGSGHPGGALSSIDILTYLYFRELNIDANNPYWPNRDRFILSKGHACAALYAVLGLKGCLGSEPEKCWATFRQMGSQLQGHPSLKSIPWVEANTGSLGQGFSSAIGMALGLRYQSIASRVYVMIGDGELQEGEIWEGIMFSAHQALSNLCVIVDYNKLQSDALNSKIINLEPLAEKWRAFNWNVLEIDGHNFKEMDSAFSNAQKFTSCPTCIIAHTIKGKGVSYMENSPLWHGSVKLTQEQLNQAIMDLDVFHPEKK